MASIGDLFFRLMVDDAGFEGQVVRAAGKAGDAGGKTLGDRLKSNLTSKITTGIGMVAGAAFGIAASGANELDAATRRLQADTGMTADEAKRAQGSLASLYRDNLQGFATIGATMAKVHNDLGLTGAAADEAAAKFLKFSRATGQDATESVTKFDDILDAWNLTAGDAGSIMDKLVVSHQKFGGVIAESESALSAMAPAMQAANMSVDDGIALLNLFNAAGIDASKAPAALARAVKALKPGQDLNDLIAQIGAIEDPTLRGQEAMKLFGARSGVGLAQAIKPGMSSLADLTASLGDTAGASDAAAEASLSWGDKATLALHKVGGKLAEFGTQFGPLLMIAAQLGPKFTTALASGIGGITGRLVPKLAGAFKGLLPMIGNIGRSLGAKLGIGMMSSAQIESRLGYALDAAGPKLQGPGSALGKILGSSLGKTLAVGFAAIAVIEVFDTYQKIAAGLNEQSKKIGEDVAAQITAGTTEQLEQSRAALQTGMEQLNGVWDAGIFSNEQRDKLKTQLAAVEAELGRRSASIPATVAGNLEAGAPAVTAAGGGLVDDVADGMEGEEPVVEAAADKVVATFGLTLGGVKRAAQQAGADGMLALAAGITAARKAPVDAFDTLKEMLKNAMTRTSEAAKLAGELTSKELARGLRSQDPAVRAQAEATKKLIIDRLVELQSAKGLGSKAMAELKAGMKSKDPEIRAASRAAYTAAMSKLKDLKTAGQAAGAAATGGVATGLLTPAAKQKIADAVAALRSYADRLFHAMFGGSTPSPWPKPNPRGGKVTAEGYATGIRYVPYDEVALIHKGEAVIPAAANPWNPAAGVAGEGSTITVNVYNPKPEPASTSTARELRKLAITGQLA